MSLRTWIAAAVCVLLAACRAGAPVPHEPPGRAGTALPPPAAQPREPEVPPPVAPPPRQFRLSAASAALVNQARAQHKAGNAAVATTTLERALRIEPDNPLLWLELGRLNQDEGNAGQADAMARKAQQLGRGDPRVQSAGWQLIAESLRARGRNQEASEAERRASLAGG